MSFGRVPSTSLLPRIGRVACAVFSSFAPVPAVSFAVVCLVVCECTLLLVGSQPIYETGAMATAYGLSGLWVSWLALAWTISLAVLAIRVARVRGNRAVALCLSVAVAIISLGVLLFWLSSWTMYLQIGRFGGWDAILFAVSYDVDDLWSCMGAGERRAAIFLAAALPFVVAGVWASLWFGAGRRWQTNVRFLLPAGIAALSLCGVRTAYTVVQEDPSESRSLMTKQAVCTQAGPAVTMVVSCYRELTQEPIRPVLDRSELVPLPASRLSRHKDHESASGNTPIKTYPVHYEQSSAELAKQGTPALRPVVVIAFESLRGDVIGKTHQGVEITPNLNRLAAAGVNLTRSYAQSTHSDYADVCLMSSLYPLRTRTHHFYRADDPWPKRLAFDHFKDAGYSTAIVSSQNEAWGGMEVFLDTPSLDLFFHSDRQPDQSHIASRDPGFARDIKAGVYTAGQLPDDFTANRAIEWIKQSHSAGSPFLLSMNFQSSHFPYWTPLHDAGGSTGPFQPSALGDDATFLAHPPEKTPIVRNAFWNGLHFADKQLGRIVSLLKELDLFDDILLVVVGENGEAFHEGTTLDGRSVVGHAGAAVEKALHVTTVMHCPNLLAPSTYTEPFEAIDLLPTVASLCGLEQSPLWQGQDAFSINRVRPEDRVLFFHVNTSIEREDAVLLGGRWKYRMSPESGLSKLFDLSVDPLEETDVSRLHSSIVRTCREAHQQWREEQLAYYSFPHYYRDYCPPTPPRNIQFKANDPTSKAAVIPSVTSTR